MKTFINTVKVVVKDIFKNFSKNTSLDQLGAIESVEFVLQGKDHKGYFYVLFKITTEENVYYAARRSEHEFTNFEQADENTLINEVTNGLPIVFHKNLRSVFLDIVGKGILKDPYKSYGFGDGTVVMTNRLDITYVKREIGRNHPDILFGSMDINMGDLTCPDIEQHAVYIPPSPVVIRNDTEVLYLYSKFGYIDRLKQH